MSFTRNDILARPFLATANNNDCFAKPATCDITELAEKIFHNPPEGDAREVVPFCEKVTIRRALPSRNSGLDVHHGFANSVRFPQTRIRKLVGFIMESVDTLPMSDSEKRTMRNGRKERVYGKSSLYVRTMRPENGQVAHNASM